MYVAISRASSKVLAIRIFTYYNCASVAYFGVFSVVSNVYLMITLVLFIIIPLLFGEYVSVDVKEFLYTTSIWIKTVIVFLLPFIIFIFLFSSLISLEGKAVKFIFLLLGLVFLSNFTAINLAYFVSGFALEGSTIALGKANLESGYKSLTPIAELELPHLISNRTAMVLGILVGIYFSVRPNKTAKKIASASSHYCITFLKRFFVPILPLFILGFIFKLEHDKILEQAFLLYGPIVLLIISCQICYVLTLYLIASKFVLDRMLTFIKNVLPAALTAITSLSSAGSMPVLLVSTEKNLKDAKMARVIVPAITNIHTIGSAFSVVILSMTCAKTYFNAIPDYHLFFEFAIFYALAKYAAAGIPAGMIIVVGPLLESILGFSPEMLGLITAIYIISDPFGTTANVCANGALSIILTNLKNSLLGRDSKDT